MPADDDLRRRFPMLGGDLDKRGLAQQTAPAKRAPGFRSDPLLVVKRAQGLLLKARMELDLVYCGRDARFAYDPFEMIVIEIRDADRANPPILLQMNQRLPAFDIAVDARARQWIKYRSSVSRRSFLMLASNARVASSKP